MAQPIQPSRWATEQFGESAVAVMQHVVTGLRCGQSAARAVQAAAESKGATSRHAYGSMWATRYELIVEQFELAEIPGYEAYRPHGASFNLAVINGRVLIPFRHSTSVPESVSKAKLRNKIPHRVSRENGVDPAPALFEMPAASGAATGTSVADAEAAARSEQLTVIYVAYVANSDSDEVLRAWWGVPISLEDDGTMVWSPELLDLRIGDETRSDGSQRIAGIAGAESTGGFAQGEMPPLGMTPRSAPTQSPSVEPEPTIPEAEQGDD